MEELDHAAYLTQRLRRLQPESYEREVGRATRRARRVGFAVGSLVSLGLVGAAFAVLYFFPEAMGAFLAVLD